MRNKWLALCLALLMTIPAASLAQETGVTLVDQAGREVAVPGEVSRIVSGYYISTSACVALGLKDRLVGVEARADTRPLYALAAPELLALPNVGAAKDFDLEGCLALLPDLVILPLRLRDAADTIAALGVPVLLVNPEGHDALIDMITLLGDATGTAGRARALTGYYAAELAETAALLRDTNARPIVYMGANSSYLSTAPRDMYQAALIETAGGINAADGIGGTGWTEVSYEQIAAMNPEVIVIPAEAAYSRADILTDPQLAAVRAVRDGRVYAMPSAFEAWDSPVPSCTLGIRWLLSVLHGDLYPMASMRETAAAFYHTFYGIDIDISQIDQ